MECPISPLGDRVIILPNDEGEQMYGNIVVPDMGKEKPEIGKVLAVGPGRITPDGNLVPNQIKFSVNVDNDDYLSKSPFNADLIKEILKANRTCLSGEFFVYSEGLLAVKFIEDNIESKYYLIRNQK